MLVNYIHRFETRFELDLMLVNYRFETSKL